MNTFRVHIIQLQRYIYIAYCSLQIHFQTILAVLRWRLFYLHHTRWGQHSAIFIPVTALPQSCKCFSALTLHTPDQCTHPHLESFQFVMFWHVFNHCTYTVQLLLYKYSIELLYATNDINRTALKYAFVSDRCFMNIISHLIQFSCSFFFFCLLSNVIFHLNLKVFLAELLSLCFILWFLSVFFSSLHVFCASIIAFPLRVIIRSSVLFLSLFLFSPSVSPPPRNSTFTLLLRARTHFLRMYSLSVHLHTTHYVTSFPPNPLSFPLSFSLPPTMSPEKNIQPRFLITSCWVTQLL